MKNIQNYVDRINGGDGVLQYGRKTKLNILFVRPDLSGSCYYRMILPGIHLQGLVLDPGDVHYGKVSVAFTNIEPYNVTKRYRVADPVSLTARQIIWADTIVFPFLTADLYEVFNQIKRINASAQIVFHVDFDPELVPASSPYKEAFNDIAVGNIYRNMEAADAVAVTSVALANHLCEKLNTGVAPDGKIHIAAIANSHNISMQDAGISVIANSTFHMVVMADSQQLQDLKACRDDITAIKDKYLSRIRITVFGGNDKNPDFIEATKGYAHDTVKPTGLYQYYKSLVALRPDLIYIPVEDSPRSQRQNGLKRFIDAAMMRTPIMARNLPPFTGVIQPGAAAIYDDQAQALEMVEMAMNDGVRTKMGDTAHYQYRSGFSFGDDVLQSWLNIYG
ncbi:MAG TPA: hypothetical protein PKZ07_14525 [Sedimentisphaerales bacterium]|nr:hypothetical protein [Sedimentisphaerales bacterium]